MLGGYGNLNGIDSKDSLRLLDMIKTNYKTAGNSALDTGAGVGRVSKEILSKHFKKIDLIEQNQAYLQTAKETLKDLNPDGEYYPLGL